MYYDEQWRDHILYDKRWKLERKKKVSFSPIYTLHIYDPALVSRSIFWGITNVGTGSCMLYSFYFGCFFNRLINKVANVSYRNSSKMVASVWCIQKQTKMKSNTISILHRFHFWLLLNLYTKLINHNSRQIFLFHMYGKKYIFFYF